VPVPAPSTDADAMPSRASGKVRRDVRGASSEVSIEDSLRVLRDVPENARPGTAPPVSEAGSSKRRPPVRGGRDDAEGRGGGLGRPRREMQPVTLKPHRAVPPRPVGALPRTSSTSTEWGDVFVVSVRHIRRLVHRDSASKAAQCSSSTSATWSSGLETVSEPVHPRGGERAAGAAKGRELHVILGRRWPLQDTRKCAVRWGDRP
jgi:hypothetical protein